MDWFMLTAMVIAGWAVVSVFAGERVARVQQAAAAAAVAAKAAKRPPRPAAVPVAGDPPVAQRAAA